MIGRGRFLVPAALCLFFLLPVAMAFWSLCLPSVFDPKVRLECSVRVLARDGRDLRLFTTRDGYWRLPAAALPGWPEAETFTVDPLFVRMLLAYEDKRFWHHPGVDPLAVARALWQWAVNGRVVSGASTITMQVVRLLAPHPRSLRGKIEEMLQALRLEARLGKEQILALYLTLAPYGGNIQGVEAACRLYFGRSASRITVSQAALLISLPQSPERRRPDRHGARALLARNRVLERLAAQGVLTPEQVGLARSQPVPSRREALPFMAPHLTARLHRQYADRFVVRTGIDADLQADIAAIARQNRMEAGQEEDFTLAVLVADNQHLQVLGHVGAADFRSCRIDLTRAVRSPGSTLKPFVYGLAFEQHILHPESMIPDRRHRFGVYSPVNFSGRFHGWVTVRQALQRSLNVPAVLVLERIGPGRLIGRFAKLGLIAGSNNDPGLSLALGGTGTTLEELTAMYAALARRGCYAPLVFLAGTGGEPADTCSRLLSPLAAWYVDDILGSMPGEQGMDAVLAPQRRIRYKTGTSYGYRDAWTIGYTTTHTVGVWAGRPDGGPTVGHTGSRTALPVLRQVFAVLRKRGGEYGNGAENRPVPQGVLQVRYRRDLPRALRWFGGRPQDGLSSGPVIEYPLDGSTITVLTNKTQERQIRFRVKGGRAPLTWLVNGVPVLQDDPCQASALLTFPDPGQVSVTVIDSRGLRDRVSFWLN